MFKGIDFNPKPLLN